MRQYIIRRLLATIPLLFVISFFCFIFINLISHDLGVLSLISDKLVVMHRGLAVERGLPEEIFEHAKDPYTRELIDRHLSVMSTFSRAIRGEKVHAA